jgi:hypothetical protein
MAIICSDAGQPWSFQEALRPRGDFDLTTIAQKRTHLLEVKG